MNDKKQRGRPRRPAPSEIERDKEVYSGPAAGLAKQVDEEILQSVIDSAPAAPTSIHQVLGQITEIITAPQEVKRSGYKWP